MGMEDHAINMRRSAYNSRDTTPAHRFTSPSQYPQQAQSQMHHHASPQTAKLEQNHQFEDHALYRLLGTDMSNYFVANLDKYETARKRWTDCTMKEWQAGAQGERQRMTG